MQASTGAGWAASTFCAQSRRAFAGWVPTTSTSIRCACGTTTLRWKFRRGTRPTEDGNRIAATGTTDPAWTESWENDDNDRTWRIIDTLTAIAGSIGRTPAQVALNWLLGRPEVTAPILGVRTMAQLEDNLGTIGWELDPADRARLNRASDRPRPYPYALLDDLRQA